MAKSKEKFIENGSILLGEEKQECKPKKSNKSSCKSEC